MNKKIIIGLLLIISLFALVGCNSPQETSKPEGEQETVIDSKETPDANNDYVELTVLNPTSAVEAVGEYAPRLDNLNGKRVAMWLSGEGIDTGYGEIVYERLAEKLKAEYPDVVIIPYNELPITYSPKDEVVGDLLATNPDALIVGVGG